MNDLPAVQARLAELHTELSETACNCTDERLEVRLRTFENGSKHHVLQCLGCGQQRGGALGAKAVAARMSGRVVVAFEPGIEEGYNGRRMALVNELVALQRQETAQRDPEWVAWAAQERANQEEQDQRVFSLVEQCSDALVAEVGPAKAADALGKKVVALRSALRAERLAVTQRFESEGALKQWLTDHLREDFDLFAEVPGRHVAEGVGVQIDFLAYPRPHLLEAGFLPMHFGIEVKHLDPMLGFSHKAARALWQSVSYTDAEFFLDGRAIRPKFVLLFSNMSFDEERSLLNRLGSELENDHALWRGLLQLANHANVGTLEIAGSRDAWTGWKMAFSGGLYFWRRNRAGEGAYGLSNARMVEKLRIGSF
jgi:hypothetical protein